MHDRLYLSKAALAQHHEEIEVGQLHAVLVAIVVEFGDGVGGAVRVLIARTDLGSL